MLQRTLTMLNTPDAGRFITQREWNDMLRHDKMEAVAFFYLGMSSYQHHRLADNQSDNEAE